MKKFIKYILVSAMAASFAACSLSEVSYSNADESHITSAKIANDLLLGVYRSVEVDGFYRLNLSMLFCMPTDEARGEGSSLVAQRAEAANAITPSDSYVQETWQALYKTVFNANNFIETMGRRAPSFTDEDKALANIYVAEAKALRALAYFELVRWFGNVPLIKTTEQSYQSYDQYVQADPNDVYVFIENDLKEAAEVLPYADEDNVREDNGYRFSKGSALGLLTKVYATWAGYPLRKTEKWKDAEETAAKIIASGHHKLLGDFDDLWKNAGSNKWDPSESLIELSYYSPLSTNESSGRVGNFNGVAATLGSIRGNYHFAFFRVVPTFIASWKDHSKDKRWAISFADYEYKEAGKVAIQTATISGVVTNISFEMAMDQNYTGWSENWRKTFNYRLFPRKWDTEVYVPNDNQLSDQNYTNVNWYVLRYADVLLLYAEAINEKNGGPNVAAYEAINMVRRRGFGAADYTQANPSVDLSGLNCEQFRQAIRDERAHELAFEGHRRQDLVRWGIYYETVQKTAVDMGNWHYNGPNYYIAAQYTIKGRSELLPIPQREIDLCGLKQNPNW